MSMGISRDKLTLYQETTSTAERVRTVSELIGYDINHNAIPGLSVLLTGASIVPDDRFTLQEGDIAAIDINAIGALTNLVVEV